MSAGPPPTDPPPDVPEQGEKKSGRNPWLWATAVLAIVAVALGAWALNERSDANDAQADLARQESAPAPATTTQAAPTTTAQPTTTQPAGETQTASGDSGISPAALAGVVAAFGAARKALNENSEQIEDLEADVDKANADADKAKQEADDAEQKVEDASKAEKPEAEVEQAEAEKRQLGAKAEAAAACARSMLEIVGEIPSAGSLDAGLSKAAEDIKALAPKCKESVASAGG